MLLQRELFLKKFINSSPMLVTKSVFKLILVLTNYQTCTFPLRANPRPVCLVFFTVQGHQGIFSLVKDTLWENCKFELEQFKGIKAMTRGHGGKRLRCLREVSGLKPCTNHTWNKVNAHLAILYVYCTTLYIYKVQKCVIHSINKSYCLSTA